MPNKELLKFKCDWPNCGHKFEKNVGHFGGGGKHRSLTTTVRCPKCGNCLKTKTGK